MSITRLTIIVRRCQYGCL